MATREDALYDLMMLPRVVGGQMRGIRNYFGGRPGRGAVEQISRPEYSQGELDRFLSTSQQGAGDPGFEPDPADRMRILGMTPEQGGAPPTMERRYAEPTTGGPMSGEALPPPPTSPYERPQAPRPEGQKPDYRQYLSGYLEELGRPVQMPEPRPFTSMQAVAMALNPRERQSLERTYRAPYQRDLQEWQMNEQRRAQAAGIAGKLYEGDVRQEEREGKERQRVSERDYQRDQIYANAGDLQHDYSSNPELLGLAQRRNSMFRQQREGKPKQPKSKQEFLMSLEDDMRARAGQVISGRGGMGAALSMFMPEKFESFNEILGDSEAEYRYMQAMRETVRNLPEEDFMTFMYRMSREQQLETMRILAGYEHPTGR